MRYNFRRIKFTEKMHKLYLFYQKEIIPLIHSHLSFGLYLIYVCKSFYELLHFQELSNQLENKLQSNNIPLETQIILLEQTIEFWVNHKRTPLNKFILQKFQAFICASKDNILLPWDTTESGIIFCHSLNDEQESNIFDSTMSI